MAAPDAPVADASTDDASTAHAATHAGRHRHRHRRPPKPAWVDSLPATYVPPPTYVPPTYVPPATYVPPPTPDRVGGLWCVLLSLGTAFALYLCVRPGRGGSQVTPPPRPPAPAPRTVTLRRVSLAIDWRQRARIQATLAEIARTAEASTQRGLFNATARAASLLRGALGAVRFAFVEVRTLPFDSAQGAFTATADELRGRYVVETINGSSRTRGPAPRPRAEEGGGLVLVTLLTASDAPAGPPPDALDAALRGALDAIAVGDPTELLAAEVVWSPSEERDRMSSAELAALYPELRALPGAAPLGRVTCGHCRAAWAAELGACPACGARAPA